MIRTETKTRVFCDRCKKEIKYAVLQLVLNRWNWLLIEITGQGKEYMDLCNDCKKSFMRWRKERTKFEKLMILKSLEEKCY